MIYINEYDGHVSNITWNQTRRKKNLKLTIKTLFLVSAWTQYKRLSFTKMDMDECDHK